MSIENIYPYKNSYTNVRRNIIYNSYGVEKPKYWSTDEWIKRDVLPFLGILLSNKKE